MKKLFLCLVTILMILSLSCVCFADGEGPSFASFKAYVSKEGGADYYTSFWSENPTIGHIDYNTSINVLDSTYKDNIEYYAFILPEEDDGNYDWYDKIKYINSDDIDVDSSLSIEDYEINNEGTSLYSFDRNGTKIYEFAIDTSDVLGTIPLGTSFYARSVDGIKGVTSYGGGTPWYFINYNNIKGFVSNEMSDIGFSQKYSDEILITKTQFMYKYVEQDENDKLIEIPKNTILRPIANKWEQVYYIEYKGFKGFVFNVANNRSTDMLIVWDDRATLYSEPDDQSEVLEASIPVDTILKAEWERYSWYKVNYNGKSGWIKATSYSLESILEDKYNERRWLEEDGEFTRYVSSYSTDEYNDLVIRYEEQQRNGFVAAPVEEEITYESPEDIDSGNKVVSGEIVDTSQEEIEFEPSTSLMDQINKEFLRKVIIGLAVAIILCITALGTVVLINKKKKNK